MAFLLTTGSDFITGTAQDDLIVGTSSSGNTGTWQRIGDLISAAAGTDTFQLTILDKLSSTIADTDLQELLSVEDLTLLGAFGATVTLGAHSETAGLQELNGAGMAGNMIVDASARWNDIVIDASKGVDTLTGGMGDDTFRFASATLTAADKISGGGFGDTNTLEITDKGALTDAVFAHVTDVQLITLTGKTVIATGQKVTLGALSQTAGINEIDVEDGQSALIDASARTTGVTVHGDNGNDVFIGSQGLDRFYGGAGDDSYQVKEAKFGNDSIDGGSGTDEVRILDGGTAITDNDFQALDSVERLAFNTAIAQSVTLDKYAANDGLTIVDASKLTGNLTLTVGNQMTNKLTIDLGNGADTLTLGNGAAHFINMKSTSLTAADHITGNSTNVDWLEFSDAVHLTDAYFLKETGVSHMGALVLDNAAKGQTFTAGANFATFVTATNLHFVIADTANATTSATFDFSNYAGTALGVVGSGGSDTFIAGNVDMTFVGASGAWDKGGADTFKFKSSQLDSGDTVTGASSTADILMLTDDTTAIVDADFTHVNGIEILDLAAAKAGSSYGLTLSANFDTGAIATIDGSLAGVNVTIDAHTIASNETILTSTKDNVITLGSGDDVVLVNPTTLTSADHIAAGTSSNGDTLKLTAAGALTEANLANISGFEYLQFSDKGNSLVLGSTDTFVTSAEFGVTNYAIDGTAAILPLIVITGKGNDTVDLSKLGAGAGSVDIIGSAGADKYIGTATDDEFFFAHASDLSAATQIDGGTGDDILNLDAGTYKAAQFKNVKNIDELHFLDADPLASVNLTLDNTIFANVPNHLLFTSFTTRTGNNTFDTSAVTDNAARLIAIMGKGNDTFKGGAESDTVEFFANNATGIYYLDRNDVINGGGGHNTIQLNDTYNGTVFVSSGNFLNTTNFQELSLAGGANTTFSLFLNSTYQSVGIDEVDATQVVKGLTLNANGYNTDLTVLASGGDDDLTLGDQNDIVVFDTSGFLTSSLDSNDTIDGGGGTNLLRFIGDTTLADADFAHVSNASEVDFVNGTFSITLGAHTDLTASIFNASQAGHGGIILGGASFADLSLTGSNQTDLIVGGNGSDVITGGRGGDILAGGGSADVFAYFSAADSYQIGADLSHADTITDFNNDQIKVSTLVGAISAVFNKGPVGSFATADQANFFINGAQTDAVAVAYDGTNTRVYVDTDHNGSLDLAHDMVINVNGNHLAALANAGSFI